MENKEIKIPAFFAEHGITSTSANHLSNVAKENYMAIEKQVLRDNSREIFWDKRLGQ